LWYATRFPQSKARDSNGRFATFDKEGWSLTDVRAVSPFVVPLSKHISDIASFIHRKSELTAVNKAERLLRHLPGYYTHSSG
jgi:hypothetical protein